MCHDRGNGIKKLRGLYTYTMRARYMKSVRVEDEK